MNAEKLLKTFKAGICMLLLSSVLSAVQASANSAQTQWFGVESTGAVIIDESCPIIVESELLTFDIPEFPQNYYETAEDYLAYSAKVTAQYTFYNPAEYTVKAHLVFPFGNLPGYAGYYDTDSGMYVNANDTNKFDITVDGEAIGKTLRHTLSSVGHTFSLEEDLPLLHNGYVNDAFYFPDMPVTKYTYIISGINEKYDAANAAFDVSKFNGETKILFAEQSGGHMQKNNDYRISAWADNGKTLTLYVLGQPLTSMPEWVFYKNGGVKDGDEIEGTVTLISADKMTFRDFALTAYTESSNVFEADWYNAIVADLNRSECSLNDYGIVACSEYGFDLSHSLMRWYEYEIILAPGKRIVNTVEAPMYPSINGDWDPAVYGYTYLLSPAQTWSDFGALDIVINTPFHLTESSISAFKKTESGYRLSLDGLPKGELEFTLCSAENPKKPVRAIRDYIPIEIITVFFIIGGAIILTGGGITAFVLIHRNKKRKGEM